MRNTSIIVAINLLLCCSAHGQSAKEQLAIVNSGDLAAKDFYEEITYEDRFGYLIVPVTIGNRDYEYIFDTGGYNTLTSEIMDSNQLTPAMEVQVGSSNQLKSRIALTKIPSLAVGNIEFTNVGAFNFDFEDSPQITCYTNGGLIGKSVIEKAVWQINAIDKKISVTDDIGKLPHLDNAFRIRVSLDKTLNPFIKAKINGKTETFLLDFGYGGLLSLTEKTGRKYAAPNTVEIEGEGAVGANGVVHETTYLTPLQRFSIGDAHIGRQVAYYAASNNYNLIGSELTKYFIVTLNFRDRELYLTPIAEAHLPDPVSTFGFDLNRNEGGMYVSKLFKGLSADQAGLKLNDTVLSVNDDALDGYPYCDFYLHIKRLFNEADEIRLGVKRENEVKIINVQRKPL